MAAIKSPMLSKTHGKGPKLAPQPPVDPIAKKKSPAPIKNRMNDKNTMIHCFNS